MIWQIEFEELATLLRAINPQLTRPKDVQDVDLDPHPLIEQVPFPSSPLPRIAPDFHHSHHAHHPHHSHHSHHSHLDPPPLDE